MYTRPCVDGPLDIVSLALPEFPVYHSFLSRLLFNHGLTLQIGHHMYILGQIPNYFQDTCSYLLLSPV